MKSVWASQKATIAPPGCWELGAVPDDVLIVFVELAVPGSVIPGVIVPDVMNEPAVTYKLDQLEKELIDAPQRSDRRRVVARPSPLDT